MTEGDTIVYAAHFLCSIAEPPTSDLWRARGVYVRPHPTMTMFAYVDWQNGEGEKLINAKNIARPLSVAATEIPVWYHARKAPRRKR